MKIQVISKRVLALCIAIIVVCFGAFLTIGYDNPVGDYNEPQLTELIMWLMYLLVVVTAGLTVWSVIKRSTIHLSIAPWTCWPPLREAPGSMFCCWMS